MHTKAILVLKKIFILSYKFCSVIFRCNFNVEYANISLTDYHVGYA
jgi:hypothetical protein